MEPSQRRERIVSFLEKTSAPISASSLAEKLSVSRQIIVGDVAILRAAGINITATPRGYVLEEDTESAKHPYVGIIACKHLFDRLKEELYIVVDFGGTLIDVTIEHALYGQISGSLNIASRYDADLFVESVENYGSQPLSTLTGGIHLHRIGCRDKETFEIILRELDKVGIAL